MSSSKLFGNVNSSCITFEYFVYTVQFRGFKETHNDYTK